MINDLKIKTLHFLKVGLAITPWMLSMYILFWLGKNEIWVPETAHRDKITIAILVVGMGSSFIIQSYFFKNTKN